jgi:excinuclease ABC subunit C
METDKLYAKLPETPGVYLMKDRRGRVLYVGKAGNLRRRVSSYFTRPHDARIQKLVSEIAKVDYRKTDTAVEALILEAELIKKLSPPYNVREKDDKSFLYVEITRERFPRVLLVRGKQKAVGVRFGPFTSASGVRAALRIMRKIFPWSIHSQIGTSKRPCFDYEIGLCPGTCAGLADRKEYLKNIRNLKLFFAGRKEKILRSLRKEMESAAKNLDFEKAEKMKRRIFALQHIQDIALLSEEHPIIGGEQKLRVEGYDISNISGASAVGAMAVFRGGKPDKDEYRKFKIRTLTGSDDVGMLSEIIRRRLKNPWPLPDLILVDGGKAQVNAAKKALDEAGLKIPVAGMIKGRERKRTDIVGRIPPGVSKRTLVRVRDEAHRFAIGYHKKVRWERFFQS